MTNTGVEGIAAVVDCSADAEAAVAASRNLSREGMAHGGASAADVNM